LNVHLRFSLSIGLILASAAAGYAARRRRWVTESAAKPIMTIVTVVAYPVVGFMAIWGAPLQWSDAWLPLLGAVQATLMALLALAIGKHLFPDRAERGIVGVSCGIGNHGVTMAGFAVYLLFGADGLGINTVYALYTFFALVLLSYTIAQHFAPGARQQSIPVLMARNLLHWRATGLYSCIVAIIVTGLGVPKPTQIHSWHLLDVCIYILIAMAYFAIGLRLRLTHILEFRRTILFVIGVRHVVGLALGFTLVGLTCLSPWPLQGLSLKVFLLQSSVSMGVLGVAVGNMFHIKPKEAAAIFVVSSLAYLLIGIPLLLVIFGE
jgi:predicted permease